MDHSSNSEFAKLARLLEQESKDSIALLENIADNPICVVRHDEDLPGILVEWRSYATSSQLRFVHEYIIHLLEQHRLHKVLGDDTALLTIHSSDQEWIAFDWMPRGQEGRLPRRRRQAADRLFRPSCDEQRANSGCFRHRDPLVQRSERSAHMAARI